jgi:diaminopimelate dehydrogenase
LPNGQKTTLGILEYKQMIQKAISCDNTGTGGAGQYSAAGLTGFDMLVKKFTFVRLVFTIDSHYHLSLYPNADRTRHPPPAAFASLCLALGINTVDSFDIHTGIVDLRRELSACAKANNAVSIISAGWDPGSDSVVRALLQAIAPKGITYTNFGPGMSMGHTVAVKAIEGVKAALSMTIPTGTGIHRRMVYIELKDGYKYEEVAAAIKSDAYFVNDETHVIQVPCVDELLDMGHGVNLTRKGVSGKTQNQLFEFNMKINNPALTAQVLICVARASMKQQPGCYTLIEVPVIDLLEGDREDLIAHLV